MDHNILHEQIAYYRERAPEYDESLGEMEGLSEAFALARDLLHRLGPFDQVLELACGTGIWTQILLQMSSHITAVDAAPEMLAIAQQKLGNVPVSYQQADVFQWEPGQQYDLVFFANWLSHVPPKDLDTFLAGVTRAVHKGGYLTIIDQSSPTPEDLQIAKEGEEGRIYALRPLRNGKAFTIVKVFYEVKALQEMLLSLGFEVAVSQLNGFFFFLSARRL